jgi:hypothetical protein
MTRIEQEFVALGVDDVVPIADAAKLFKCEPDDLLRRAAKEEIILYAALEPHSKTLQAVPSHQAPRKASSSTNGVLFVALLPQYVAALITFDKAVVKNYQASFGETKGDPLEWHYWALDTPQNIEIDRVYFAANALPITKAPERESVWKPRARDLAQKFYRPLMKQLGLATEIARAMKEEGFTNDRGGELKAGSIRKEVLTNENLWLELKKKT